MNSDYKSHGPVYPVY